MIIFVIENCKWYSVMKNLVKYLKNVYFIIYLLNIIYNNIFYQVDLLVMFGFKMDRDIWIFCFNFEYNFNYFYFVQEFMVCIMGIIVFVYFF